MMNYPLKPGNVISFKASKYSPVMSGEIKTSGRNLLWVKASRCKGAFLPKDRRSIYCISHKNVIFK